MALLALTLSAFASYVLAIDQNSDLEFRMTDLYVFKLKDAAGQVIDQERVTMLLSFARHESSRSIAEVFLKQRRKIRIFVSLKEDLSPSMVVDFFFGGQNQYAVTFNEGKDAIVGSLGEVAVRDKIKVYAGLRDDPSFLDFEAYTGWRKSLCKPVNGLRCSESDAPVNSFAKTSAAIVALELPVFLITSNEDPKDGRFKVWAKSYVAD